MNKFKPGGYSLLNVSNNYKTIKGDKKGEYLTGILYLAPANTSGYQVCPASSKGCRQSCLFTSGNAARFKNVNQARIRKTKLFFENPSGFWFDLIYDIKRLQFEARYAGVKAAIRLNGTSDIDWENKSVDNGAGLLANNIMKLFPDVVFYDYTKRTDRDYGGENWPENYSVTFSLSEDNDIQASEMIDRGLNVAVVFKKTLPDTFWGLPVYDGDSDDLRFLDPENHIVGLKAKGKARKDESGFVR